MFVFSDGQWGYMAPDRTDIVILAAKLELKNWNSCPERAGKTDQWDQIRMRRADSS